ncbi:MULTISPECIES: DUF6812 domain-containing protein [Anaerolinea]|uniref:Uncharacterized protein n=1 Tax=Anaerolinea thermophila (strain DSM 14523 / JCM 11388 / NBRC 100420 / UNI-1) TaxID=926569 RepID=E8N4Q2_ANATU|nr:MULTISPECIES: hypothetical protein [Anaerolinea]BAJ63416.1 hypothetical protein ANT_13880 [Anaerolinea thermophila UNI-1]
MVTQYDEKGKIFTQVISKKPVPVIVQTTQHTIRGTLHVRPSERIIDELNASIQFIAITEASVLDLQGNLVYKSNFLTLNKEHVVWIIPDEEIQSV